MKLIFLAHASFLIITNNGTRIIFDPYKSGCFDGTFRYQAIADSADVVLTSHQHDDHNGASDILGNPKVFKDTGHFTYKDIKITGIASYHDTSKGTARGKNIIYVVEADSLRIVHLGDLGHNLNETELKEIGKVDVLLIPVGGYFTIDSKVASSIVNSLKPQITVPMHYKTDAIDFPIVKVDEFLKGKKNVNRINSAEVEITKQALPKTPEIWVLNMAKESK
jgi:L-ascorbate metabolism protein UlaG (beta-lactamase superfamily)